MVVISGIILIKKLRGLKGSWQGGVLYIHSSVEVSSLRHVYGPHPKTNPGVVFEDMCLPLLFIGYMTLEKLIHPVPHPPLCKMEIIWILTGCVSVSHCHNNAV